MSNYREMLEDYRFGMIYFAFDAGGLALAMLENHFFFQLAFPVIREFEFISQWSHLSSDVDIDELMAGLTEAELLELDAELERDVIQDTSHSQ